jgi:hypothetical protein
MQYYLQGTLLQTDNAGALDLWATDGHSMHHATIADIPSIGGGGIVPADAVGIICGIGEKAADFAIMVSDRGWHAQAGAVRAWGKVIDGSFPNMKAVISQYKDWLDIVVIGKKDLTSALVIASCGADTSNKARSLIIRSEDESPVIIRGFKGATGIIIAGRAETEAKAISRSACAVSAGLITRALSALPAADVVLSSVIDGGVPALRIRPAQADAILQTEAIVMCMRATPEELADA